ncbi:helix-turn-helix domain-containing protein [Gryllotalpicola protaetiae]|uniref:DNA-binding protein n=1 Tax=Gryllotalpicola protaetiae TaxID=2419771 RepID=A0A387BS55_9MICO|nr:helix-turn-helix domain-containing protein [Gryllotalpicola protaetiae]AYG05422.1 DNA-binding protein [Gryllotalpicola protaetiae]
MISHSAGDAARFLTTADCAEILNVEVADVSALVETGELPAIKVGAQWRIEREVLESYIASLYEEQRRHALWEQSDYASLAELSGGTIIRPGD